MNKIKIILAAILCVIPGIVFGDAAKCSTSGGGSGTCYVDSSCSTNGDGTVTTCNAGAVGQPGPFTSINYMDDKTYAAGDSIQFKAGTTYAEQLTPTNDGSDGNPIIYTSYGSGAMPIISGGARAVNSAKNYIKFRKLNFSSKEVLISAGVGVYFNYCQFDNAIFHTTGTGTEAYGYNSMFLGNATYGVQSGAGSKITLRNSVIVGNGTNSGSGYGLFNWGTIDYDYNLISGNGYLATYNIYNDTGGTLTDGGHNQTLDLHPYFHQWKNGNAYFTLTWDADNVTTSELSTYADSITAGVPVTVFVIPALYNDAGSIADLNHLRTTHGWEIACHNFAHIYLTATSPFTVSTTNTGDLALVVDTTAKTVALTSAGNPENNVSVNFTDTNGAADTGTIQTLVDAVSGKGWTVTANAYANAAATTVRKMRLKALANQTITTFPASPTFDTARLYPEEIADCVSWVTTNVAAPTTMAYPNGATSSGINTYIQGTAGLSAARGYGVNSGEGLLSSLNIYNTQANTATTSKGAGTEAAIRTMARHDYIRAKQNGMVVSLIWHSSTELSSTQLNYYIDELQDLGASFVTYGSAVASIRADHSTADNITYTKAYTNLSNYNPLTISPLIYNGTSVSETTDAAGNPIRDSTKPCIGLYEAYPKIF